MAKAKADFSLKKYKDCVLMKTSRPVTSSTAFLSPFPRGHPLNRDKSINKEDMLPTSQHKFIASHVFGRSLSTIDLIHDPTKQDQGTSAY